MAFIRLKAAIACAALMIGVSSATTVHALDAFWHGVRSDVWGDGISGGVSNWYSEAPPNGVARPVPTTIATFAEGALRFSIVIRQNAEIGRMRFTPDAPLYAFVFARNKQLLVNGVGISNQSNTAPRFRVLGANGEMRLTGAARMVGGNAPAAQITTVDNAALIFDNTARGGDAEVINTGDGATVFNDRSSAEEMDITNRDGGLTLFQDKSTGGTASIFNGPGGDLECTVALGPTGNLHLPMGEVDNRGRVLLGRVNLDLTRTYSQSADGALVLIVASKTSFGAIKAGQNATVGGSLIVSAVSGVKAGTYKIVSAGGARKGKFASVKLNGAPTLKARLAYSAKEVSLILEPK